MIYSVRSLFAVRRKVDIEKRISAKEERNVEKNKNEIKRNKFEKFVIIIINEKTVNNQVHEVAGPMAARK